MSKESRISIFNEKQYSIWHYNDVKKCADEALADGDKELYTFLNECLCSQSNLKPRFESHPG